MGQRFSSEQSDPETGRRTASPTKPDANGATASLYDELFDRLAECPFSHKRFLPLDILHEMVTAESVRASAGAAVQRQPVFCKSDLAGEVVRQAKKVFAILVLVDRHSFIGDLFSEGLTDEDLPLSRSGGGTDPTLVSARADDKRFETFRDWKRPDVDNFLEKQWLVQAPVFDSTGRHITLDRGCALPLQPPVEQIGATRFSKVFRCALHPAHYQQGFRAQAGQVQVAIKEFDNRETFNREKENLTMIQNLNNRHLIKHIATCERGSRFYVIFPLANGGSLLEYWERENKNPRDSELVLWSLRQMLGLTGGMCALHNGLVENKHCRHGDLKPANILLFEEDGDGILVIADLGVSRIHTQATDMRTKGTVTLATTRSYEAPEAYGSERRRGQGPPRSRTYDMWSLGCVFLEFAIWLLYDFNAITNFETNRRRHYENPHSSFYQIDPTGKPEISSGVLDAIKALQEDPRCNGGTALKALVNLVADKLLVTTVKDRCKAEQLWNELEKIVQEAEQNPLYLLNVADQPSPTPKVFLHVEQTLTSSPETQMSQSLG